MAVTAVVITHCSEDVLPDCLASLAHMAPEVEVVVVDNASTDGTVACARRAGVRVFANRDNLGFSGGVNQGFRETEAECVLVLNPDIRLVTPLAPVTEACLRSGLAAPQLTHLAGDPQARWHLRRFPTAMVLSCDFLRINWLWPNNPWNRRYVYADWDYDQAGVVDQPAGAFLMIRRDVWERLGGFDERFHPVWFEDVDFCLRAAQAGYRTEYVPSVRARHLGGQSIKTLDASSRQVYWYDSLLRYAAKHFRSGQYRGVCLAAMLSLVPRTVFEMIRQRSLKPISTGFYLLFLTGRRLVSRPPAEQRSWRGIMDPKNN